MTEKKHLIFYISPASDALSIARQLHKMAEAEEDIKAKVFTDVDVAITYLRANGSATLCQIYTAPEYCIARAIHGGDSLQGTLSGWIKQAQEALLLHRQYRQRSLLFEATHFHRYSAIGLDRLGLSFASTNTDPILDTKSAVPPLHGVIAQAHINARPEVLELREELDASAQILSNETTLVPPLFTDVALQEYRAQTVRLAEIEHERNNAMEQASRAIAALATVQTQTKAAYSKLERQAKASDLEVQVRKAELAQLEETLASTEALLKAKEHDIDRLNDARESGFIARDDNINALTQDLHKKQEHVAVLEGEIARIMSSKSIRLTAPIRSLRALFGRKRHD